MADTSTAGTSPARPGLVLVALVLVAGVANLNLSVANVALPEIGRAFDSSQSVLNLIAVGYSLGLAASVLYLGAVGDSRGRKRMLVAGMCLSVPACLLAAYAPTDTVLFGARVLGGLSAGMAYPTTLSLIAALWTGPARTRAIALWSSIGGAISALGPLAAGATLQLFWWGAVFLLTLPMLVVALAMALRYVPAHVHEGGEPVDHLGGVLSVFTIAGLVLAVNFAPMPRQGTAVLSLAVVAAAAGIAFVLRQRRARFPLYDLAIASRRVFWVAALAGMVVFGSLMGALFIGQQFMQNVLGYTSLQSGAAVLPSPVLMALCAPASARFTERYGARFTLLVGYSCCLLSFTVMLLLWHEHAGYWRVGLAYALLGAGVGFAGTPASRSLTNSVPVTRAGMASGTADLQRDLGGSVIQSVLGALLTAGYAASFARQVAASPEAARVGRATEAELQKSFAAAADTAARYPAYADQITAAARAAFLHGDQRAYAAAIVAILGGIALVWFLFPRHDRELALLAEYARGDPAPGPAPARNPVGGG
ncbi:MFS transporter [Catellatospora sp. TT07R-123]|uniref:MFS transporter n=1 Tax=Catellatospora sp. TT07R-123 TaxID=2733863 RepID=UPI001B11BD31|nr:MFS transporter [Catellatospora sp. TT07R-123]GHJ45217.1 MFS transporter [Catellatospora sp. TT07R-123]